MTLIVQNGDWPPLLPQFATHIAQAAERAKALCLDEPKFQMSIELNKLSTEDYCNTVVNYAKSWRAGSGQSTIYVFSYDAPVPQTLITTLRNAADESLKSINASRAFSKCNAQEEGHCLYVGHSYKFDRRLRDHLGWGSASTSSLHLKHWDGHPHDEITLTAYRLSKPDRLLAQLLEEYLWDELKPLLGKRGGK